MLKASSLLTDFKLAYLGQNKKGLQQKLRTRCITGIAAQEVEEVFLALKLILVMEKCQV
jgi:hypothetical protein